MRTRNDLQASEPTPTAPQTSHGRQEFKENEKRRKSNHDVVSDKARLGMQTDIDAHQEDKTREKQKENALRLDKRMLAKTNAAQKIGGTNKKKIGDGANLGNHAQSIDVTLDTRKPEKGLETLNESAQGLTTSKSKKVSKRTRRRSATVKLNRMARPAPSVCNKMRTPNLARREAGNMKKEMRPCFVRRQENV